MPRKPRMGRPPIPPEDRRSHAARRAVYRGRATGDLRHGRPATGGHSALDLGPRCRIARAAQEENEVEQAQVQDEDRRNLFRAEVAGGTICYSRMHGRRQAHHDRTRNVRRDARRLVSWPHCPRRYEDLEGHRQAAGLRSARCPRSPNWSRAISNRRSSHELAATTRTGSGYKLCRTARSCPRSRARRLTKSPSDVLVEWGGEDQAKAREWSARRPGFATSRRSPK